MSQSSIRPGAVDGSGQSLVLCEVLCFTFKKYNQIPFKTLKSILSEFYTGDQICNAKDTLIKFMDIVNPDKWVRPPKRRKDSKENVGYKLRQDVDDILNTITFVDENNIRSKLPLFVTADPDLLPTVKLTDGDLACVMNKLSNMELNLNSVKAELMDEIVSGFGNMLAQFKRMAERNVPTAERIVSTAERNFPIHKGSHTRKKQFNSDYPELTLRNPAVDLLRREANAYPNGDQSSTSGGEDLTSDDALEEEQGDFQVVANSRKKRKLSPTITFAKIASGTGQPRQQEAPTHFAKSNVSTQPRRNPLVGGSTTCSLKASKTLQIKKKVYKLANIDASYTCTDVTNYITTLGVRVVSCFALPRQSNQPEDNTHYRICVFATDAHKLFQKDNWYSGITIQEWFFKPKVTGAIETGATGNNIHKKKNYMNITAVSNTLTDQQDVAINLVDPAQASPFNCS